MTCYDHKVPDELVNHTVAMCGQRGRAWLDELPDLIGRLEKLWSVRVLEPFPAIEFNFVAPAVRNDDEQVVIKIAPLENHEARGEAKYLRTLNGDGAVKLLAEDSSTQSILIERALPGDNLAEIFEGNEESAIDPAIGILKRVLRPSPDDMTDVLHLDDWFNGLRRYASTDFPVDYAKEALDLYDHVLTQDRTLFYLHGDYHPANIVSAARSPFLAIDPKGIVGPVGYDIAVFLNNYHWWQETRADIRERLDAAVQRFSEAFDLGATELRQWAFAQMVLGAWWTFDEMPEIYQNEVVKADVWDL